MFIFKLISRFQWGLTNIKYNNPSPGSSFLHEKVKGVIKKKNYIIIIFFKYKIFPIRLLYQMYGKPGENCLSYIYFHRLCLSVLTRNSTVIACLLPLLIFVSHVYHLLKEILPWNIFHTILYSLQHEISYCFTGILYVSLCCCGLCLLLFAIWRYEWFSSNPATRCLVFWNLKFS